MSGPKSSEGEFSLQMDDDLLKEAVAAVDKRFGGAKRSKVVTLDEEVGTEEIMAEIAATFSEAEQSLSRPATGPLPPVEMADDELSVELDEEGLDLSVEIDASALEGANDSVTLEAEALPSDTGDLERLLEAGEGSRSELEAELATLRDQVSLQQQQLVTLNEQLVEVQAEADKHKLRARKLSVLRRRQQDAYDAMSLRLEDQRVQLQEWEGLLSEGRAELARMETERERLKNRHHKELAERTQYGQDKLFRELLPVLDNLDLTLQHADTTPPEKMVEGVEMVLRHFQSTLDRMGLTRVGAEGERFDPTRHEAIRYTADAASAGTIIELHQAGYMLHDRLVRAARVTVSSGPEALEAPVPAENEVEQQSASAGSEE